MRFQLPTLSVLVLLFGLSAFGAPPAASEKTAKDLFDRLLLYRHSLGIKADLKKSFFKQFDGSTDKSEGEIWMMSGRMKIKIKSPNESKSLLVMNSKGLWLETPFEEGFPPAVTKLSLSNLKRSEGIWNILIGKTPLAKNFNVSATEKGTQKIYQLTPKAKDQFELSTAEIIFTDKDLDSLSYSDQMQNKVTYEFSNWKKGSLPMRMFEYTPPKGATVTEL